MRRLTAAVAAACLAVPVAGAGLGLAAGPAAAQDATEPPATEPPEDGAEPPEPVPGEEQCAVGDLRLIELSGLVAVDDGYIAVNDSTEFGDRQPIFILDQGCQVVDEIAFPSLPRDPEDLELDRGENVLWVGDTGDNAAGGGEGEARPSVALWRVELDGDRVPVIHRFTYPDGEPRDAEALVLDGDGTPIIVTKGATAELFTPEEVRPSTAPEDTVALEPLGELSLPETDTDNPLGAAGRQVVTGGANSPDGSTVVLRSYADAFEFEVADGQVAPALIEGDPLITPLPDEPQGEAISYSADGEQFLTVSEAPEGDTGFTPAVLGYAPAEPAPPPEEAGQEPAAQDDGGGGGGGLFNDLQDIINLIAAVGIIGLLLVAAGVFGIVRARRRGSGPGARGSGDGGPDGPTDAPVTGRARLTGFPGEPADPPANQTGVYTSGAAQPSGEYGEPTDYDGTDYRAAYPGPPATPAGEYGGGEYRGSASDYRAAYPGPPATPAGEYGAAEYGGGEYAGGQYDAYPSPPATPAGQYGDPGYGDPAYGGHVYGGQPAYGGAEPGYAGADPRYPGHTYGQEGYPQPAYDQDWPNGYQHPANGRGAGNGYQDGGYAGGTHAGGYAGNGYTGGGYAGNGYTGGGYAGDGYTGGGYPPPAEPGPAGGTYAGGAYQSGGGPPAGPPGHYSASGTYAGAPDYSDDPDYPYEFRERDRW